MIEITGLYKTFHEGRAKEVRGVHGVNLTIAAGEFVVIVGSNGSGKSTLLNLIAGSIFPSTGTIKIDGLNISSVPEYRRSQWIARVFQNPLSGTAPDLTILENFRLAALRTQSKRLKIGINERFKNVIREKIAALGMGLENKLEQQMGTLSGGQRQALTLLMCVMDDLKILLLDEPTAALDPRSAELVMKTADKLIKDFGLTAFMVTHNMKEACNYGNRLILMGEGKILKDVDQNKKLNLQAVNIYDWFL